MKCTSDRLRRPSDAPSTRRRPASSIRSVKRVVPCEHCAQQTTKRNPNRETGRRARTHARAPTNVHARTSHVRTCHLGCVDPKLLCAADFSPSFSQTLSDILLIVFGRGCRTRSSTIPLISNQVGHPFSRPLHPFNVGLFVNNLKIIECRVSLVINWIR